MKRQDETPDFTGFQQVRRVECSNYYLDKRGTDCNTAKHREIDTDLHISTERSFPEPPCEQAAHLSEECCLLM